MADWNEVFATIGSIWVYIILIITCPIWLIPYVIYVQICNAIDRRRDK